MPVRLLACLLAAVVVPVAGADAAETPALVRVAEAVPADTAETLRLTGTVTAERRAGLSPRVSGLVSAVHVDAGDRVAAGAVLLELDRALAEIALAQAKAALDEARTQLAEAKRLQREADRLVKDRHIPETEARAREATVQVNTATVARLTADARAAAERLERHSLVAPFAGVISRKLTEAGEWVETGTSVLELVGTENLRLDVQVPQERFAEIDAATPVTVRFDGLPQQTFPGQVIAKVPVNDPGARTFLLRVGLENLDGQMIPGMSAQAAFGIRGAPRAVAIPRDALVREADGDDRVWVLDQNDGHQRVSARQVELGRSLAETVEVLGGIEPGEIVVIRGNEALREGQRVRVVVEP